MNHRIFGFGIWLLIVSLLFFYYMITIDNYINEIRFIATMIISGSVITLSIGIISEPKLKNKII